MIKYLTYLALVNGQMFIDDSIKSQLLMFDSKLYSKELILENMDYSAFLYTQPDTSSCHFRIEMEYINRQSKRVLSSTDQFLRVGLGNIDELPIIQDGDIQGYPTTAYYSEDQKCEILNKNGQINIKSRVKAPKRVLDPEKNFENLEF